MRVLLLLASLVFLTACNTPDASTPDGYKDDWTPGPDADWTLGHAADFKVSEMTWKELCDTKKETVHVPDW